MSTPIVAPATLAHEHTGETSMRKAARCAMVILGAGGDLTRRKLMPALAHLACDGLMDPESIIIGVGRDNFTDDSWRAAMGDALKDSDEMQGADGVAVTKFLGMLRFVRGDLRAVDTYKAVTERVTQFEGSNAEDGDVGRLIYLAIPPSLYPDAAKRVSESGLVPRTVRDDKKWARIVIEKPFGRDLDSARALDKLLLSLYSEQQIYRIDHYLGKETVQNILVLRFANSIFEPVWNRNYVHHVQITAAETVGVEHRASYYEESGVIRDMFQNHLMQLLTLTAMEPPNAFDADAVRGEKAKVLGAIHPVAPERCGRHFGDRPVRARRSERRARDLVSRRAGRGQGIARADVRGDPVHGRQLAVARRAVLPPVRQAPHQTRHGDRGAVQGAPAFAVPLA